MDEFRIGDKVWNIQKGWGEVIGIDKINSYSVKVKFGGDVYNFTKDGKFFTSEKYPSLFFEEIKIPESAYKRPKWRAREGEYYFIVSPSGKIITYCEHFSDADNTLFEVGNYFQTKEQAIKSKFYQVFHEKEEE